MVNIINKNPTIENRQYYGLQVLRGICCLCIPIVHSFAYTEWNVPGLSFGLFFGRAGMLNLVTIFMMLSAYLTVMKLDSGTSNFVDFIKGRIYGIFPIYWMCVVTNILINLCTHNSVTVAEDFWKSLLLIPCDTTYICGVEWTLWYEVTFYLLISVFFVFKWGRKLYPFALVAYFVAYVIKYEGISTSSNIWQIPFTDAFLSFFVGSVLFYLTKHINFDRFRWLKSKTIVIVGCALSFVGTLYVLDFVHFVADNLLKRIFVYLVCCACVLFFKYLAIDPKNILVRIGDASYGIYLLHPTVLQVMIAVCMWRVGGYSAGFHIGLVVVGVCICFVIATVFKRLSSVIKKNSAKILPKWLSY